MGEMAHTKISQYKRVLKKMSDIPSLGGGSPEEIVFSASSALLQLNIVVTNCEDFEIPFESLFNIRVEEFLGKYLGALEGEGVDRSTGSRDLLDKVCGYLRSCTGEGAAPVNGPLVLHAHTIFTRRFEILMSETENATILEEIKLEKMKYETINDEQLKVTYRNSYITLIGLLLTALLTVANIAVTSTQNRKR